MPSVLQLCKSIVSKTNEGGTELSAVQFLISLLVIASSVKTGLRAISSSVGIPTISSELLSLNEVYPSDSFNPLREHEKIACLDSPSVTSTFSPNVQVISVVFSSIPFIPIKLTDKVIVLPFVRFCVIKLRKLKDSTPPVNLNPVNCLNDINNSAIFLASSIASSSDIVLVVGSYDVPFVGITLCVVVCAVDSLAVELVNSLVED